MRSEAGSPLPRMAWISPRCEKVAQGEAGPVLLDRDRLEQRRRRWIAVRLRAVGGALNPMHSRQVNAVLVRQHAADEHRRGLGVERYADALAFEVLGRPDRLAVDRDEAVAKDARGKYRQRHQLAAAGGMPADDLGARHLAGVELEILPHAIEDLARTVDGEEVEIDPLGLRLPGIERQHAVVEAAGERHRQFGHVASLAGTRPPSRSFASLRRSTSPASGERRA